MSFYPGRWLVPATLVIGIGFSGYMVLPVQAETLLEQTGEIIPAEKSHTFEGKAQQSLTIILESTDFDPVLSLIGPGGTEVAINDDFGGTLNSTIIITLPEDGIYTVVARSFSGQGGAYSLVVRSSTPYEMAYNEAQILVQQEDFSRAIAAYTRAIEIDPQQSSAYLGRAEAYLGEVYADGTVIESPQDIPEATRESIIADFEAAADLIEATGNPDWATSLREQANYLRTGEAPFDP